MTPDTSPEAIAAIEQSTRRQHFTDVRHVTVRWEPYKPDGARQMKAKGRWQEQVGTGVLWRWQNCERPAFAHDPDDAATLRAQAARIAQLEARAERAEAEVARLRDINFRLCDWIEDDCGAELPFEARAALQEKPHD